MSSTTEVIDRYNGEYEWLSNGAPAVVWLGSLRCSTVEHGYNAAKTLDMGQRAWVVEAQRPFGAGRDPARWGAKKRGSQVTLRPGWDEDVDKYYVPWGHEPFPLKVAVMEFLLRQKFAIPDLGLKLLDTDTAELVEGNHWHDNFWGRCTAHERREDCPRFDPEVYERYDDNNLGRLQMQIRDELTLVYTG